MKKLEVFYDLGVFCLALVIAICGSAKNDIGLVGFGSFLAGTAVSRLFND